MVEVKATADDARKGCNVSISMEGQGQAILEETLAVVQGVMDSLKDQDVLLHMLALKIIADEPSILLGQDEHEGKIKAGLAKLMSKGILKKGVN